MFFLILFAITFAGPIVGLISIFARKPVFKIRTGVITMLFAAAGFAMFYYMQTALNVPDGGMEYKQFYRPLACYTILFLVGLITTAYGTVKKLIIAHRNRKSSPLSS